LDFRSSTCIKRENNTIAKKPPNNSKAPPQRSPPYAQIRTAHPQHCTTYPYCSQLYLGRGLAFIIVQPITNLTGMSSGELEAKYTRKCKRQR
jgi:hypothetical protein